MSISSLPFSKEQLAGEIMTLQYLQYVSQAHLPLPSNMRELRDELDEVTWPDPIEIEKRAKEIATELEQDYCNWLCAIVAIAELGDPAKSHQPLQTIIQQGRLELARARQA